MVCTVSHRDVHDNFGRSEYCVNYPEYHEMFFQTKHIYREFLQMGWTRGSLQDKSGFRLKLHVE